jgi:hypothetical protein
MEKKGRAPSDLNRTAARLAGPGQAAGLGPAWLSPTASAHFFFLENHFDDFVNPCKFEIQQKLFCASKNCDSSFCEVLILYAIHFYCMCDF